jgi:tetratricopeptide (TPR) repeat protein
VAKNRKVFEESIRAGADAAWNGDWGRAIAAYQRALAEFPQDVGALTGLGLAHSGAGQLEAALESYQQAVALAPDDPGLHERAGRTWEQLGRGREAADAYLASAERYLSQQQAPHLALERWQDAVRVCPDCLQAHTQLLQYYRRQGQLRETVQECLALARIYQAQGQREYAVQICEYALKLAPHAPEVLAALDDLRYGAQTAVGSASEVTQDQPKPLIAVGEQGVPAALDIRVASVVETDEEQGSPVDVARQRALAYLAESFFDEVEAVAPSGMTQRTRKAESDVLIGRALDFQTRGRIDEAIAAYEKVKVIETGVERPAVRFLLGLLYQEKTRFDAAIAEFERAVSHPEYALGSHFALGECYRAQGRIDEAVEHFVEVLKVIDLANARPGQADDLAQIYESLADSYIAEGAREQALGFTNSLVEFLSQTGWETKVVQARHRLDELVQEGPPLSLAEMLAVPGSERVLESIALAQEYVKRGLFYAALEECQHALGLAPTCLPIHWQLAQVLVAMGQLGIAVSKFVVIGDAYWMRGSVRRAAAVYQRALELAPMDTVVRAKLIDLLISHGRIDEALEHYLTLADIYYQLAQIEQARKMYQEALQLAPRGSAERRWEVRILHEIGDIHMQRVEWRRAVEVYEQICKLAPEDERARSALMHLYYRLDRPELAIVELDSLLKIHRKSGDFQRIFDLLEDEVHERPDNILLRTRLAQAYLDAGNAKKALEHLDKLGDLLLEAGRYDDAKATIRAIIALQPPNVAAYEQLLDQIGEHSSS